jgi:hypothetical protein
MPNLAGGRSTASPGAPRRRIGADAARVPLADCVYEKDICAWRAEPASVVGTAPV